MKLYANSVGKGQPLIIAHGLYGSSDNWLSIARELQDEFEVHMLDMRNHGRSPHSNIHNYDAMAQDIKEYVENHKLKDIVLLGHSMGGKASMLFTLQNPELVAYLLVADIAPKDYKDHTKGHRKILETLQTVNLKEVKTRTEVANRLEPIFQNKRIVQFVLKNLSRQEDKSFKWDLNVPVLLANLDNIVKGTDGWDNYYVKTPTLFLKGEHSPYLTLDDNFLIKKYFQNSDITTIPNAGHWLHAEQPELIIKTILYFTK